MVGLVAFGQEQERGRQDEERDDGQQYEYPAPAESRHQETANGRGRQRRDADHQEEQREDACAFLDGKEVADHGDGVDLRDAASERFKKAQCDEYLERVGRRAADGGKNVDGEADVERTLSSEAVQQRAIDHLPERKAHEVGGESKRDRRSGGPVLGGDGGERRQVHVDCEGRYDAQRSEQNKDPGIVAFGMRHPASVLL